MCLLEEGSSGSKQKGIQEIEQLKAADTWGQLLLPMEQLQLIKLKRVFSTLQ